MIKNQKLLHNHWINFMNEFFDTIQINVNLFDGICFTLEISLED